MSTPNTEVIRLLDLATARHGFSEYQVAKRLGVPQTHVAAWKAGRRTCVPADVARLAGLAGEDAVQALVRATLEQTAGTPRGEQLWALMGKPLRQIGAASISAVVLALSAICWPTPGIAQPVRYDVQKRRMRFA
jgi:transcriptional regulator with XRE-family HTH domain